MNIPLPPAFRINRAISFCCMLLALLGNSTARGAEKASRYVQLAADTTVSATRELMTVTFDLAESTDVLVFSDGRVYPINSAIAGVYATLDGQTVTSEAIVDWRGITSGAVQHSYHIVGSRRLLAGHHQASLWGTYRQGSFAVGAGTGLAVMLQPATTVSAQLLGANSSAFDFVTNNHFDGVTPVPHQPILTSSRTFTNEDVIALGSGSVYRDSTAGDAMMGLFLDGNNPGNDKASWTVNDLCPCSELEAPVATHAFLPALSGTHTVSFDASEFPWSNDERPDRENSVVYRVGAGASLVVLGGGMTVANGVFSSTRTNSWLDYEPVSKTPPPWDVNYVPPGTPKVLVEEDFFIPSDHNGVVAFMAKTRVQASSPPDSIPDHGTVSLWIKIDGTTQGTIGVQQISSASAVSQRTITASYLATGSHALAPGWHHVQVLGKIGANDVFVHLCMNKDLPLIYFDGDRAFDTGETVYANSFELAATESLSSWTTWANCNTDNTWSAAVYGVGAPDGGQKSLRLHTTGFTGGSFPGTYALSPTVPAQAGATYRVSNWSRNSGATGDTVLFFLDANGAALSHVTGIWSTDAWQFNADADIVGTAPAGTTALQIRYHLGSPNYYADLDRLVIRRE